MVEHSSDKNIANKYTFNNTTKIIPIIEGRVLHSNRGMLCILGHKIPYGVSNLHRGKMFTVKLLCLIEELLSIQNLI